MFFSSCLTMKHHFTAFDWNIIFSFQSDYEKFVIRQCLKVFEENAMVVFCQTLALQMNEQKVIRNKLFKKGMDLVRFSNPIIRYSNMSTVQCCYNVVNFLENPHKRHPIARPLGRGMGCLVGWHSDLYYASVTPVTYVISCHIGPCYNGTQLNNAVSL